MTFGEIEDDTGTGGWFTPARKSPAQSPDSAARVTEADPGASSWFTPSRQVPQRLAPGDRLESGPAEAVETRPRGDQGLDRPAAGGPANGGAWREISGRGVTAANRWAEVTRGGRPAGVNPRRGPDGDGFGQALPGDIPFRGARPIDVSPRGHPPARQGPAYSAYSAAASSAPGLAQRRSETGTLRKIRESGAVRAIMDTGAMRTLMDTTAMQLLRERYAGKGRVIAIAVICVWVIVAAAALWLLAMGG
ncbi:MAG TPA: hypothetical protein VMG38_26600 [Trebonia sp.]|nr:hypothetical protein [Trebonia sp.]